MSLRFLAAVALLPLAACSGSASSALPGPAGGQAAAAPSQSKLLGDARHASLAYVSDFDESLITVFRTDGSVLGTISALAGPEGIFVDRLHNLWVANRENSNVLEFARGATKPSKTLDDTGAGPVDVTVCPSGTVYVANVATGGSGDGPGNIAVYSAGSTTRTATLTDPNEANDIGVTCDAKGNVFSTIVDTQGNGEVVEYSRGRQTGFQTLPIALSSNPGAVKSDAAGNILVADQSAHTIAEYTETGMPTGSTLSTGPGSVFDFGIADGDRLVGATDDRRNGIARAYSFPGGTVRHVYMPPNFTRLIGFAFDTGK